jgi:superfamily I DNA/RNA helicase
MPNARARAASGPALDADQAEAVLAPPGPLLVLAGAGAGKTRVLTERAAAMVANHGQPAEASLVITFTNKAADELRERLERLIGEAAGRVRVTPRRRQPADRLGCREALCLSCLQRQARRGGHGGVADRPPGQPRAERPARGHNYTPRERHDTAGTTIHSNTSPGTRADTGAPPSRHTTTYR